MAQDIRRLDDERTARRRTARLLTALIFGALALIFGAPALAAVAVVGVTLPPEKTVAGPRLLLGEVAFIEVLAPSGRALAEALGRVDLGPSPPPGQTLVLRRDDLKKTLLATGLDMKSATWQLPPELTVTAAGGPATEAELRAALEKYLAETEPYQSGRFEILSLNLPPPPEMPEGPVSYRFQPQVSANPLYVSGHFIFSQNGRDIDRLRVTAQVDLSLTVLTAARNLPRGRVLAEDDLSPALLPFSQARGALTDPALAVGAALKTSLAAGEPIRERALGKSFLVKRGDPVTIVARQGRLSVSAAGLARADGALGDVITVTNLSSKKNLTARVTGPSQVEVLF